MTLVGVAPAQLADYREEVLHPQSALEIRVVRRLGQRLRACLRAAGLSRQQFAEQTGLAVELIVAVENGYGQVATARRLLRLARIALTRP